ncbi:phage portal protein [Bacillus sp. FJAT-49736]|uniref:phage tail assembly chaperone n=1 Tax=Bacillus sp. FJAT-49736 TaxID=2833582 RepID=UPI001BC8DA6F|nr:phage portal protein [Bacillus sp. FJAT-49736]MBS4172125.1 phage portal protein [Bacillus sp. FJAT-49736]
MNELQAFFAENVSVGVTEDFVISERFKDKDGNPIKWKLRALNESENEEIRKSATKRTKMKKNLYLPEVDNNEYMAKLAAASVVFPDLKNADLQKSYGVLGAENLLKKMLLSGEYGVLIEKVQEINGFDNDINDLKEDIKN